MGCKILVYHGIEKDIINPIVQKLHCKLSNFEKHIDYLMQYYEVISLDNLIDCLNNGYPIDSKTVVLTFDDGYKNNLHTVLPFLSAKEIPFSVFISTKHVSSGIRFPTYLLRVAVYENYHSKLNVPSLNINFNIDNENSIKKTYNYLSHIIKTSSIVVVKKVINDIINSMNPIKWIELNNKYSSDEPMNWDDIKTLTDKGVIIGSHCDDHFLLHNNQTDENISKQLIQSKKLIKNKIGKCNYFCYPNGGFEDVSNYAYNFVKKIYNIGLTTEYGEVTGQSSIYLLPRIVVAFNIKQFQFGINTSFRLNKNFMKNHRSFIEKLTY